MLSTWKTLIIALALTLSFSQAQSYSPMNIEQLLIKKEQGATINIPYLQDRIVILSQQAGTYPTQFSSEQDKNEATKEASILLEVVKAMTDTANEPSTLYLAMQTARIAHNLDIPNAAEYTIDYADRFIEVTPKDSTGYFFMGAFLSESGKISEAKPYLNQAIALGNEAARWSLAMSYLFEEKPQEALKELELYQKSYPDDLRAKELINAINSNSLDINKQ